MFTEEREPMPPVLYHATYREYLDSIMAGGLGTSDFKNWSESKRGVVYLAEDPYVAESYATSAEEDEVPLEFIDNVVVLAVSTNGLDQNKFFLDDNNLSGDTFEYHGAIPPSNIKIHEFQFEEYEHYEDIQNS